MSPPLRFALRANAGLDAWHREPKEAIYGTIEITDDFLGTRCAPTA
jgi:hypothetical protein